MINLLSPLLIFGLLMLLAFIRLNRWLAQPEAPHPLMGDDQYAIDHDRVNEGYPIEQVQS